MLSTATWPRALTFALLLGNNAPFVSPASVGPVDIIPDSLLNINNPDGEGLVNINFGDDDTTNVGDGVRVINRDVCVIGGGSGGTYAAIRLRASGQSVTVIEKKNRLGGHTETYIDPESGRPLEAGVVAYHDMPVVRDYFEHFNITLTEQGKSGGKDIFVDFTTGEPPEDYDAPQTDMAAMKRYGEQLAKYPWLNDGFESIPDQVPEDLLMPFGQFVDKYNLQGMLRDINKLTPAMPDRLEQPTLYLAKMINSEVLKALTGAGPNLGSHEFGNSELYKRAHEQLTEHGDEDSLLLNAEVQYTSRTSSGVDVIAKTPSGIIKVHAKKLIVAIPPEISNLRTFGLDDSESSVFRQLNAGGGEDGDGNPYVKSSAGGAVIVTLIRDVNISTDTSIWNAPPDTPYHLPDSPSTNFIQKTGVGKYFAVAYTLESCSHSCMSDDKVQADILDDLDRLRSAGTMQTTDPEFVYWTRHDPLFLGVDADSIRKGFYKRFNALQGHRNTYYTGAAFQAHDSSLIWDFTEKYVIPRVLE